MISQNSTEISSIFYRFDFSENHLQIQLEDFFSQIIEKINKEEQLELFILDVDRSSYFNYDEGYYKLAGDVSLHIYSVYTLINKSEKIAKLLKFSLLLLKKVSNQRGSTKRELYYNDVELFKSTVCIDELIHDVCSVLNCNRFDLNIFASQKGLFAGDLIVFDEEGIVLNNSNTFDTVNLISSNLIEKNIYFESTAEFILVVEKESLFFNIINNQQMFRKFSKCIVVTGKGYADYATKIFLKKLLLKFESFIPVFYFGDFDPFGLEIYLNYLFGSKSSSRENQFMSLSSLKWIGLSSELIQCVLTQEKTIEIKDFRRLDSLLYEKEYFNFDAWEISNNIYKDNLVNNLNKVYQELIYMKTAKFTAEAEVVISTHFEIFLDYLEAQLL